MYYEVKAIFIEELDNGRVREISELILVAGSSIENARGKAETWLNEDMRQYRISHVKETRYRAVLD